MAAPPGPESGKKALSSSSPPSVRARFDLELLLAICAPPTAIRMPRWRLLLST